MLTAAAAVVLALALLLVGAALGGTSEEEGTGPDARNPVAARGSIEALQARLERLPGDYTAWTSLGLLYVDRARVTGDPTFYPKAEGALTRSLEVKRDDNAAALTGLATLQAARHEFAAAAATARQAIALNAFDAGAYAVLSDALNELGRYDEAATAVQTMADLKPSFAALARASYVRELRGDVEGAQEAMQRALKMSFLDQDAGFAHFQLGELAWNNGGNVEAAAAHYDAGLRRDPESLPLQAAAARVAAARGDTEQALRLYESLTSRVPVQQYLVEHGELLASLGRPEEAQEQFEVVRAANALLKANGAVVDLEVALFEADHGKADAALSEAQAAYSERQTVFTEDALGWALHVAGRDEEALRHADAALALGIEPASFLFHRAMIEKALGRDAAAAKDLRAALAANPHFSRLHGPTAREVLRELES